MMRIHGGDTAYRVGYLRDDGQWGQAYASLRTTNINNLLFMGIGILSGLILMNLCFVERRPLLMTPSELDVPCKG